MLNVKNCMGGGYTVEEYEALQIQKQALEVENQNLQKQMVLGIMRQGYMYGSSNFDFPTLFPDYFQSAPLSDKVANMRVLKPIKMKAFSHSIEEIYGHIFRRKPGETTFSDTKFYRVRVLEWNFEIGEEFYFYSTGGSMYLDYQLIDQSQTNTET